ncbi:hypothetical protein [Photobacterium ganghwense]|uniref:hypothetical protein n=1 Tax=Photobacterium ganghwense TaxID=320778 RepID=UPI001C2CD91F|nr:hypothetical protein [Photobacterium ganghwense]MBV1843297.1 hypothetical protein [Photobacterium ganghwense]
MYRKASLVAACVLFSGCMTTQLMPPASDFASQVPAKLNEQLKRLNDEPAVPFRGGMQTFHYDEDTALLTLIYRLPNPRWTWGIHKAETEAEIFPKFCKNFGAAIDHGLGVRAWFAGNGSFETEVLTPEICQTHLASAKN